MQSNNRSLVFYFTESAFIFEQKAKMKHVSGSLLILLVCLRLHGVSGAADKVRVAVKEGDSVTLYTGVQTNQHENIDWYIGYLLARINGDLSNICTDVQCNEYTERFRGRLKLDHQTGSLTIMDIRNTDSGDYALHITSESSFSEKIFIVYVTGVSGVDRVSVMEGDSVILNSGVQTHQQDRMTWYLNGIRIALINRDQSKICTDVQCNNTERFRGRLELDNQTGSLIITNITNTDSGEYTLLINNRNRFSVKIFSVSFRGVSGVDTEETMEGDPLILNTGVLTNQQLLIRWYYMGILIAEITGENASIRDSSFICSTDVQCNEVTERFRDRLKLDHHTGSLSFTNTRNTHSGVYKLMIISDSRISEKIFSVSVHALPGPGPTPFWPGIYAAVAVAVAVLLLILAVICCYCKRRARRNEANRTKRDTQASGAEVSRRNTY